MGFVKKIPGIKLFKDILGGDEKPAPVQTPKAQTNNTKTASEIAAEEEAKKKAQLIALNAGGQQAQQGLGGSDANVTKKNLLGL